MYREAAILLVFLLRMDYYPFRVHKLNVQERNIRNAILHKVDTSPIRVLLPTYYELAEQQYFEKHLNKKSHKNFHMQIHSILSNSSVGWYPELEVKKSA
jgi:hypothetical protein